VIPDKLVILVVVGALIRASDDLAVVLNFLLRDSAVISWDPDDWGFGADSRWVVRIPLDLVCVVVVVVDGTFWDETAEGVVVGVDVWLEELLEHAWGLCGNSGFCRCLGH